MKRKKYIESSRGKENQKIVYIENTTNTEEQTVKEISLRNTVKSTARSKTHDQTWQINEIKVNSNYII